MRIELLLEKLARNEKLKSSLEEISNLPSGALVDSLMKELEHVVERYKDLSLYAGEARHAAARTATASQQSNNVTVDVRKASPPPFQIVPDKITPPPVHESRSPVSSEQNQDSRKTTMRKELESMEQLISAEVQRDWNNRANEIHERILQLKNSKNTAPPEGAKAIPSSPPGTPVQRDPVVFKGQQNEELYYLYGIELPTGQGRDPHNGALPTMIGIDGRNSLSVCEVGKHKVIFSRASTEWLTITHSGMMLLGKQESEVLRHRHEQILNTVRVYKGIVPFTFGTVVRGKEELLKKCSEMDSILSETTRQEAETRLWTLKLNALDSRVGKFLAEQEKNSQFRDRGRMEKQKRIDIKALEKILHRERKAAETVHDVLSVRATSASIVSIVNFAQGTSPDWKVVLHASYEIEPEALRGFFIAIQTLQEENEELGMMFSITGAGRIDFSSAAVAQATSA